MKKYNLLTFQFKKFWDGSKYLLVFNVYETSNDIFIVCKSLGIYAKFFKSEILSKFFNRKKLVFKGRNLCIFFNTDNELRLFYEEFICKNFNKNKYIFLNLFRKTDYFFDIKVIKFENNYFLIEKLNILRVIMLVFFFKINNLNFIRLLILKKNLLK